MSKGKKLAIVGIVLGFIIGISMLFICTLMFDMETKFPNTAGLLGILGGVICLASVFGIGGVCGVLCW